MSRRELGRTLLRDVSRSFYLSMQALPAQVRAPIGLAYLLARASDTMADSAHASASTRLQALDFFREQVRKAKPTPLPTVLLAPKPGEQMLLTRLPEALQWLAEIDPADRADIQWVLAIIIQGQRADLTRIWPVQSDAELDEYTYAVAGCVGEFWTRICLRHLPRYATRPREEMIALGVRFGKGLQLVNILRDRAEDERAGRSYLPAEAVERWTKTAHEHLDAAQQYIAGTRNWRVRYACILPWHLALQTLARLQNQGPDELSQRVKVPRRAVYALMLRALPALCSNQALKRLAQATDA